MSASTAAKVERTSERKRIKDLLIIIKSINNLLKLIIGNRPNL
jgi:hypothetical protein